jgi:tRNA dimethylallyltransferase
VSAPPLIFVIGPTATGKSEAAIAIARSVKGEVISADAFSIYRGFDIGTAKPSPTLRTEVPHHLIDIADPSESYSAGRWAAAARRAIADIEARGSVPIVAGGSLFYIRALIVGLPGEEVVSPPLRAHLAGPWSESDRRVRKRMLDILDPVYGARVPAGDTARLSRGLEIIFSTGRRVSDRIPNTGITTERILKLTLQFPREAIYTRVQRRVSAMWHSGWPREVEGLLAAGVPVTAPAFRAIGYRELAARATRKLSDEEAFARIVSRTNALAKRQATWLASEPALEQVDLAAAVRRAVAFVGDHRA